MSDIDPGVIITPDMSDEEIKQIDDEMKQTIADVEAAK